MVWQNLEVKELRYQNLQNKRLQTTWLGLAGPSLPRPWSRSFDGGCKVGCHRRVVEISYAVVVGLRKSTGGSLPGLLPGSEW